MAFSIDDDGNIELVQGDSGTLTITGLNTDRNYTLYFAIQDADRNPIGSEIMVETGKSEDISIEITAELTDLLEVGSNEDYTEYYYGLKICYEDDGLEDTLFIGDSEIGDKNTITVYPKKVEGTT